MTPEAAVDVLKHLVQTILEVALPLLLASMVVGLLVSLVQTVTSLHEQTLTFVPKALAVLGVFLVALPWIARKVIDYTEGILSLLPTVNR